MHYSLQGVYRHVSCHYLYICITLLFIHVMYIHQGGVCYVPHILVRDLGQEYNTNQQ